MKWVMFPDPREQESIKNMEPVELAEALLDCGPEGNLLASAVYDVLYAESNREKAAALLKEGMKVMSVNDLAARMAHVATFRVYVDQAPVEEQTDFLQLCQEVLGVPVAIPELTQTQKMLASIVRKIS